MKFQGIRHDFEYARMRFGEALSDYLTRQFGLTIYMKMYGEVSDKRIV